MTSFLWASQKNDYALCGVDNRVPQLLRTCIPLITMSMKKTAYNHSWICKERLLEFMPMNLTVNIVAGHNLWGWSTVIIMN